MARVEQRKTTSRIVTTWGATLRRSFRRFFSVIKKPSILSADWIAPQIVFLLRSLPFPPRVMLTRTRNTVYSSFILATRAGRVPFHPLLDLFSPFLRLSLSLSHQIFLFTNLDLHPTGRSDHQRPVNHSRRERTLWVVSEADRSTTEP